MTDPGELARALAVQAAADVAAIRALLRHEEVPDSIVGFHAQQAAEKLLIPRRRAARRGAVTQLIDRLNRWAFGFLQD